MLIILPLSSDAAFGENGSIGKTFTICYRSGDTSIFALEDTVLGHGKSTVD